MTTENKRMEYSQEEFNCQLERVLEGSMQAMEQIMEMTTPLIKSSIKKYFLGNMPYEDLLQEGYLVIAECLDDYDPDKQVPFLGYAKTRLKFYYMDLGRRSNKDECDSLNRQINGKEGAVEVMELVEDESSSAEGNLLKCEEYLFLLKSLKILTARESQIIRLYYFQNKTMKEIASGLELSYRTVVNIKTGAIKKLRGCI
ncbi:RNA polymerase sporulation-specific sigma factor [Dethiosulfatibacter aminovorans DSM 17477]|uniref:RNA polymerase sporulation-specific sigma factor n=1 Tax=Dethiosulfatibacter aminovorans DSM 17477 TaxID=1121476 RepID=A0A1M6LP68_9FIRM|nr:sigma-70 family RNA polymerase sigma factor [Dethiosulfatibacter aminovorans]SHJ72872.1 RNA polymerase sporulation-specific sigma factor [Dethiosulfatibacter aminovorans DSM 17477]